MLSHFARQIISGLFQFKHLSAFFAPLAIVCALKNLFCETGSKIFKTTRSAVFAFMNITIIGKMQIFNDMTLLNFPPLNYLALTYTQKEKHLIFTFLKQKIAPNLGGMVPYFGFCSSVLFHWYNFRSISRKILSYDISAQIILCAKLLVIIISSDDIIFRLANLT